MGLDMYLEARVYVGGGRLPIVIGLKGLNRGKLETVIQGVAVWRKGNAIHKWFVDNVQDGDDDCRDYYVTREQLVELVELCEKVLAHREMASELLPTQEGFFFGGTDYDENYFQGLEDTVTQLEKALKLPDNWSFHYSSSW